MCVRVRMCIGGHMCVTLCVHHVLVCACMCVCVLAHVCICWRVCMCVCMHARAHEYIGICVHGCVRACRCVYVDWGLGSPRRAPTCLAGAGSQGGPAAAGGGRLRPRAWHRERCPATARVAGGAGAQSATGDAASLSQAGVRAAANPEAEDAESAASPAPSGVGLLQLPLCWTDLRPLRNVQWK